MIFEIKIVLYVQCPDYRSRLNEFVCLFDVA